MRRALGANRRNGILLCEPTFECQRIFHVNGRVVTGNSYPRDKACILRLPLSNERLRAAADHYGTEATYLLLDERCVFPQNELAILVGACRGTCLILDVVPRGIAEARVIDGRVKDVSRTEESSEDSNIGHLIGAIRVTGIDLDTVLSQARGAASADADSNGETPWYFLDLIDALQYSGVSLQALDVFPLCPGKQFSPDKIRILQASRGSDGFFSTALLRPVSRVLTARAAVFDVSPNSLTTWSLLFAGVSAVLFGTGHQAVFLVSAALMYISLVLDCSDGELARFTGTSSKFGAWFDGFTDRIKEHLIIAGMAIGAWRMGTPIWGLASLAVFLITVRHLSHYAFIETVLPGIVRNGPRGMKYRRAVRSGSWTQRPGIGSTSPIGWISRILHAPVSERWTLLAVFVVIDGPRTAILAYSIFLVVSIALTTFGWLRRTAKIRSELNSAAVSRIIELRDAPRRAHRSLSPVSWVTVPGSMLLESLPIILIVIELGNKQPNLAWMGFIAMVGVSWLRYEYMFMQTEARLTKMPRVGSWASRTVWWSVSATLVIMHAEFLAFVGVLLLAFLLIVFTLTKAFFTATSLVRPLRGAGDGPLGNIS